MVIGAWRHIAWLAGGIAVAFLVPFVFADQLGVQKDVFYGVYALAVAALCAGWMKDTDQSGRDLVARHWRLALVLGLVAAAASVLVALTAEDATSGPGGMELAGALIWRGLVYGATDGVMLTAFPILVVFAAFASSRLRRSRGGTMVVGAIALVVSVIFTATYHLGYSDFRSEKLRKPVTGDLIWSAPVLATMNPIGGPLSHAALHVTAVANSYETDLFLPPH